MDKKPAGNSRLFFIEFLIVLFFFLIISTVCLKLFAQAHQITERADDLSHAQAMAASAAELLLAGYAPEEAMAFYAEQNSDGGYVLEISELTVMNHIDDQDSENSTLINAADGSPASNNQDRNCNRDYIISIRKDTDMADILYELSVTTHSAPWEQEVLS